MIRLKDIRELQSIISGFKKENPSPISSFPISLNRFQEYCDSNRLFYEQKEDALFVYADEINYYELFYMAKDDARLSDAGKEKDVLINEAKLLKNEGPVSYNKNYLKNGFKVRSVNYQFINDLTANSTLIESEHQNVIALLNDPDHQIACEEQSDRKDVKDLWLRGLKNTDIPASHFVKGSILTLSDTHGSLIGAGWYDAINERDIEWRHIVVDENARGKGFGRLITLHFLFLALKQNRKRAISWIEENNTRSMNMHEKLGFRKTNRISIQYII